MPPNRYGIFPPGNEKCSKVGGAGGYTTKLSLKRAGIERRGEPVSRTFQNVLLAEAQRHIWTWTATAGGETDFSACAVPRDMGPDRSARGDGRLPVTSASSHQASFPTPSAGKGNAGRESRLKPRTAATATVCRCLRR